MSDTEDREAALLEIQGTVQWEAEPALTQFEVEQILDKHQKASRWVTVTALGYDDVVQPTVRNGHVYKVTKAGTTGATEPIWPTKMAGSIIDGTVTFEEAGLDSENVYDIRGAIHEVCMLKAAKAAETIGMDGEEKIFDHWEKLAFRYSRPYIA